MHSSDWYIHSEAFFDASLKSASSINKPDPCVEAKVHLIYGRRHPKQFYRQYHECLRYLYEKDVRVTDGSDAHRPQGPDDRSQVDSTLGDVGFWTEDCFAPTLQFGL